MNDPLPEIPARQADQPHLQPVRMELFPALTNEIYAELRRIAAAILGSRANSHTLQPTGLANTVLLRMAEQGQGFERDPERMRLTAARMAWRAFLDYERARKRDKRGGGFMRHALDDHDPSSGVTPPEIARVRDALAALTEQHPDVADVVVAKFFGGATHAEIADDLRVGVADVEERWDFAKRLLWRDLRDLRAGT